MSGVFKSVAKVFSPIASLLGVGPKKPKLDPASTQSSGLKAYDPSKHPAATPLERNPNIVGGPGAEAMLKQWDAAKEALAKLGKKPPPGAKNDNAFEVRRWTKKAKPLQAQIDSYESQLLNNLWTAPPQAPTPAPAPAPAPVTNPPAATPAPATIAPKPATPAPAAAPRPAPVPVAAETPAAAAATSIVGTASAGTLGTNTSHGGGKRGRRGRVASLLGTIGGGDTERFGG